MSMCRECWDPIEPERENLDPETELCATCAGEPRFWFWLIPLRLFLSWFGTVDNGLICKHAPKFPSWADPHDYHVHKGGDGHPAHFTTYTCHKCEREFSI